jgi:hypothetical protein
LLDGISRAVLFLNCIEETPAFRAWRQRISTIPGLALFIAKVFDERT